MKFKKQAVDLTDLALGVLVIGIVASVGATILLQYQANRLTTIDTFTTVNESLSATDAGDTLNNVWFKSLTKIVNTTSGVTVPATNYTVTVNPNNGIATVDFAGSSTYNGTTVKATYVSYNTSSPDYALAGNAATGLGEFGNWFDIIVIVGVAAVILSLIFIAFGKNQASEVNY